MEDKSNKNSRFTGLTLIAVSLTLLLFLLKGEESSQKNMISFIKTESGKNQLQSLWEKDFQVMKNKKLLNEGVYSLKGAQFFLLDNDLHAYSNGLKVPIKFDPNGKNNLEVSFMSHYSESDDTNKIVIQYNLIDIASGDMFWEHSRTLSVENNKLIAKKKPRK